MLFETERHEPLIGTPWDVAAARDAIERIAAATQRDFTTNGLWPAHALDSPAATEPLRMLYFGAAGVMWGLDYLHEVGAAGPPADFAEALAGLLEPNRATVRLFTPDTGSLLVGDAGILLLSWKRSRSPEVATELAKAISGNEEHPALELMLGSPGTMLAALAMHEWTGDESWAELFRRSASALGRALEQDSEHGCYLWTQDFLGARSKLLGAVHGFAGNAFALIRGRRVLPPADWRQWQRRIVETITATALRAEGRVNWPQSVGTPRPGRTALLVQHCHGAPGVVTCLAELPDSALDELLSEAGELIWTAGPLQKGANLCHGTAGNGYAFLKLFRRTRNQLWLDRARAFAMHGIAQCERHHEEYGRYRYSLWTGDLGLAIYLWSCIRATDAFPTMDVF